MKMKQRIQVGIILVGIVAMTFGVFYWSSQQQKRKNIHDVVLSNLRENQWEKRDRALQEVRHSRELIQDETVKEALLNLLAEENAEGKRIMEKYRQTGELDVQGEAYGEYNIDLVDIIIRLKTEKAIPLLIDALAYGPKVAKSLAEFGDVVIPLLLEKCRTGDEEERWWCLKALVLFYRQTTSPQYKSKIKNAILVATNDSEESIRDRGVEVLKLIR